MLAVRINLCQLPNAAGYQTLTDKIASVMNAVGEQAVYPKMLVPKIPLVGAYKATLYLSI